MKKGERGIKGKMMRGIITPTIIILLIVAFVILMIVKSSITGIRSKEIAAESAQVSNQISEYFTRYMETTRQLAANNELQEMFGQIKKGTVITGAAQFESVLKTMTNAHHTDNDNILVCWIADADSSQCVEDNDSGYISRIGEWDITSRDWYEAVIKAGTTIVTEPYKNSSTGQMVSSVITPVFDNAGDMLGVAAVDVSVDTLGDMMSMHKLGSKGFFMLLTPEGNIMYAPEESVVNSNLQDLDIGKEAVEAFRAKKVQSLTYSWNGSTQYGSYNQVGETGWSVLSGMPEGEYNEAVYKMLATVSGFFLLAIILLTFVINWIATGIVRPLKELRLAADKIAEGNLDVEISTATGDEVGAVSEALNRTVVRLKDYISYIDEITVVLNEIAEGNLKFELKQQYAGEFQKVKQGLEELSARLTMTLENIGEASAQVSGGADQIASGAQALADGTTSQAAAIQQLQAAVTEIASQVSSNAQFTDSARQRMAEMNQELYFSNEQMGQAVDAMKEIRKSSDEIENIITTIQEIAGQTNLLSLNASIEAARAGEMGRGFAVVAEEVGSLAGESMEAVKVSTALIQSSLNAVQNGTEIVNSAASKMEQALGHMGTLQDMIENIDEASQRQNEGIEQIKQALEQVSTVISDNSAMSEESAAASEELSAQSQNLSEMIQTFNF